MQSGCFFLEEHEKWHTNKQQREYLVRPPYLYVSLLYWNLERTAFFITSLLYLKDQCCDSARVYTMYICSLFIWFLFRFSYLSDVVTLQIPHYFFVAFIALALRSCFMIQHPFRFIRALVYVCKLYVSRSQNILIYCTSERSRTEKIHF